MHVYLIVLYLKFLWAFRRLIRPSKSNFCFVFRVGSSSEDTEDAVDDMELKQLAVGESLAPQNEVSNAWLRIFDLIAP